LGWIWFLVFIAFLLRFIFFSQENIIQPFALVEQDEDGVFVAEVPSLPGCISQGNTGGFAEYSGGHYSLFRKFKST
jgi:hypothetical protein